MPRPSLVLDTATGQADRHPAMVDARVVAVVRIKEAIPASDDVQVSTALVGATVKILRLMACDDRPDLPKGSPIVLGYRQGYAAIESGNALRNRTHAFVVSAW